jgi:hypothetical protein
MKCRILDRVKFKTPEGEKELTPGQVANLPHDTAIRLINEGRVEPIGRIAYRVYSEILGAYLWVVADEADMEALRASEDVTDPIYTAQEIGQLKELKEKTRKAHLKTVYEAKKEFPGSKVVQVNNHEGGAL